MKKVMRSNLNNAMKKAMKAKRLSDGEENSELSDNESTNSSEATGARTAAAVAKRKGMTLEEKIDLFKQKHATTEELKPAALGETFTKTEINKLYIRLTIALEKVSGAVAKASDDAVTTKNGTAERTRTQKRFIAWLLDPEIWSSYLSIAQRILQGRALRQEVRWVSKGRLQILVGSEEVAELIASGELKNIKRPSGHYRCVERIELASAHNSIEFVGQGKKQMEQQEALEMMKGMSEVELGDVR